MFGTGVVLGSQQSANERPSASDVKFAGHVLHSKDPLTAYVFVGHVVHAAVPVTFLTLPAAHKAHGPPFRPVLPALQEQLLRCRLPADEFEFAGQLVHAALPFVGLYVPAGHVLHCPFEAPVYGPVYPVLHDQAMPQFGGSPYTCTSTNCRYEPASALRDNLRNCPYPTHV
jgi:hypothetical protein